MTARAVPAVLRDWRETARPTFDPKRRPPKNSAPTAPPAFAKSSSWIESMTGDAGAGISNCEISDSASLRIFRADSLACARFSFVGPLPAFSFFLEEVLDSLQFDVEPFLILCSRNLFVRAGGERIADYNSMRLFHAPHGGFEIVHHVPSYLLGLLYL